MLEEQELDVSEIYQIVGHDRPPFRNPFRKTGKTGKNPFGKEA
jgi:hypothetical protein